LMAVLMPALAQVRAKAKAVACMSNLKQWGAIFAMYTGDNDGYFQEGWTVDITCGDRWFDLLRPYFGDNNDILFCPTAPESKCRENGEGIRTGENGKFSAWGKFIGGPIGGDGVDWTSLHSSAGSYGINIYVCNPTAEVGFPEPEDFWRTTNVKNPGEIPLLFDSLWLDVFNDTPADDEPEFDGDFTENGHIFPMKNVCIDRHSEHVNMLFLDLTVRRVGLKELWLLKWHRAWYRLLEDVGTPAWDTLPPEHWMYNMKNYEYF